MILIRPGCDWFLFGSFWPRWACLHRGGCSPQGGHHDGNDDGQDGGQDDGQDDGHDDGHHDGDKESSQDTARERKSHTTLRCEEHFAL